MKKKIERRKRIVKRILAVTMFISFMLMLGFVKSCDIATITLRQCIIYTVPCLAIFGFSAYLYDAWFGNYID